MYIRNLDQIGISDLPEVGGKAASLGEMIRELSNIDQADSEDLSSSADKYMPNVRIPPGFVVTVSAYRRFLEFNHIYPDLEADSAVQIRETIMAGIWPDDVRAEIIVHFSELKQNDTCERVAVRSSATAEDLPEASFAGQQDTFLNVSLEADLLDKIKSCFASLYNDRAVSYRKNLRESRKTTSSSTDSSTNAGGSDDEYQRDLDVGIAVVVQEMVNALASGVAFSLDTESGFDRIVLINATWGLGELLVSGQITPDEYIVFKDTGKLISRTLGPKTHEMVYENGENQVRELDSWKASTFCLNNGETEVIGKWVKDIERHYSREKHVYVDVEWALSRNRALYVVQARPETIHSQKINDLEIQEYYLKLTGYERTHLTMMTGIAVGNKIASGCVKIVADYRKADNFNDGDILVTDITNPDWEPLMRRAGAIITDRGSRTSHVAIVSREMGLPAIVGTNRATQLLRNGQRITISCAEGEVGKIYRGFIPFSIQKINLEEVRTKLAQLSTKIMLNVGNPYTAFKTARLPTHGVGLARLEFIITNYIGIHPMAIINRDPEIMEKTRGYSDPIEFFVEKLSQGMGKIGAAFYPEPVIVRFSDFKTNEYANLLGGHKYEPSEENPMLGWRGASRYYSEEYRPGFELECRAIRRVREQMKLTNIIVMIPFCRTVEEMDKVLSTMAEFGLSRATDISNSTNSSNSTTTSPANTNTSPVNKSLQVYMMAEIPSNIILAEEFAQRIDGFSIGSNDLTQLVLGVDRDSARVSHVYDERNPAVKTAIQSVIQKAKIAGKKVGICGQAPSDYPDFAKFLVDLGIDSISVTPDVLPSIVNKIYETEFGIIPAPEVAEVVENEDILEEVEDNIPEEVEDNIPEVVEDNIEEEVEDEDIVEEEVEDNIPEVMKEIPEVIEDNIPEVVEEIVEEPVEEAMEDVVEEPVEEAMEDVVEEQVEEPVEEEIPEEDEINMPKIIEIE